MFILYFCLFSWLITYISFFRKTLLNKWVLITLFAIKIIAGLLYAWFYQLPQNIATADTWQYYKASLPETDWLLRNPSGFVKDLFYYSYTESGGLFSGTSSYWNDLKANAFIKLMAVFNVCTGKSYYCDIIFFNFLYFFGPAALFRLSVHYWNHKREWLVAPTFLVPSFVFWCSGIHKDGLIFSGFMLIIYFLYRQLTEKKIYIFSNLVILFCCLVLFAFRNFILLLLVPATVAWFFAAKVSKSKWLSFLFTYIICGFVFFAAKYVHPALNFPLYVVNKQAEFNVLTGNSKINLPLLYPTINSFFSFLPFALDIALLQPHITSIQNFSYMAAVIENMAVLFFIALAILIRERRQRTRSFVLFLLFFSLSYLLLSGYTVTFSGAIVRYKSIAIPLLVTAVTLSINWREAYNIYSSKILKK